jgi:hypothetical protein
MLQDDALYRLRRCVKSVGAGVRIVAGSIVDRGAKHPAHFERETVARTLNSVLETADCVGILEPVHAVLPSVRENLEKPTEAVSGEARAG